MAARRALVRVSGKFQQLAATDSLITGNLFRVENVQATAVGQTSFTVPNGYVAGSVLVWLNGALLSAGDYTATTSPTIVLAVGTTSATDIMAVACLTASTTVSPAMTGASSTVAGAAGLVPQPGVGQNLAFLRGDGTWATPGVASGGTGATNAADAQTNLGIAGNPNLLINGRFQVNQRQYVSGTATTAANQYTYDRWKVVTSGQNLAVSGNVATCPAGGLTQVVDGTDIITGTYTLSWTGTATATVGGVAVANGGQVSLTAGTNATVTFSNGTLSFPKLEVGSVKTAWNDLPVGDTTRLCQRFFIRFYAAASTGTALCKGVVASSLTTAARCGMPWPVRMRAMPAVTFTGMQAYDGTNLATVTNMGSYCTVDVLDGDFGLGSSMSAAGKPAMLFLTTTTSYLQADAEL